MTAPARDGNDALAALERLLLKHNVITQEQAQAAARLLTGDPDVVFPPPRPPPAPPEGAEPSPADNASASGSESP